jgi:hypothetical protein
MAEIAANEPAGRLWLFEAGCSRSLTASLPAAVDPISDIRVADAYFGSS